MVSEGCRPGMPLREELPLAAVDGAAGPGAVEDGDAHEEEESILALWCRRAASCASSATRIAFSKTDEELEG